MPTHVRAIGNTIRYVEDRGSRCHVAHYLDPHTKQPQGKYIAFVGKRINVRRGIPVSDKNKLHEIVAYRKGDDIYILPANEFDLLYPDTSVIARGTIYDIMPRLVAEKDFNDLPTKIVH